MGASARAPTAGGRRWRKTGALALVVCVLAITVVQRRQPTMLWRRCPAGLDYRSRRCVRLCDDLASCMPDFDSLLVTWPDGPPGLAAAARTLVPYTIRIEVLDRTGASLYPSSAGLCPDPSFSLLLEGSGERMLVEEPRRLDWGVYEVRMTWLPSLKQLTSIVFTAAIPASGRRSVETDCVPWRTRPVGR